MLQRASLPRGGGRGAHRQECVARTRCRSLQGFPPAYVKRQLSISGPSASYEQPQQRDPEKLSQPLPSSPQSSPAIAANEVDQGVPVKDFLERYRLNTSKIMVIMAAWRVETTEDLCFVRDMDILDAAKDHDLSMVMTNRLRAAVKGARQLQKVSLPGAPWAASTATATAATAVPDTAAIAGSSVSSGALGGILVSPAGPAAVDVPGAAEPGQQAQATTTSKPRTFAEIPGTLLKMQSCISTAWALNFSPDGKFIAAGFQNGVVTIFDAKSLEELDTHNAHSGEVTSLVWSPDGGTIVTTSHDCTIQMYRVPYQQLSKGVCSAKNKRGHKRGRWTSLPGVDTQFEQYGVAFSSDGRTLVGVADDGCLRVWDLVRNHWRLTATHGLTRAERCWRSPVNLSVALYEEPHNGRIAAPRHLIAVCGRLKGDIALWDLSRPDTAPDRSGACHHGSRSDSDDDDERDGHDDVDDAGVADSHEEEATEEEYDEGEGALLAEYQPSSVCTGQVYSVSSTADGKIVVAGTEGGWLHVYRTSQHCLVHSIQTGHASIFSVAVTPCSGGIICAGDNSTVDLYDEANMKKHSLSMARSSEFASAPVVSVAISRDGSMLAAADDAGTLAVWKVNYLESS